MRTDLWLTSDWVVTLIGVAGALFLALLWFTRPPSPTALDDQSVLRRYASRQIAVFGAVGDLMAKLAFVPFLLYLFAGSSGSNVPVWLYVITTVILVVATFVCSYARELARDHLLRTSSPAAG